MFRLTSLSYIATKIRVILVHPLASTKITAIEMTIIYSEKFQNF